MISLLRRIPIVNRVFRRPPLPPEKPPLQELLKLGKPTTLSADQNPILVLNPGGDTLEIEAWLEKMPKPNPREIGPNELIMDFAEFINELFSDSRSLIRWLFSPG